MPMFNAELLSQDRVDSFRKGGCLDRRSLQVTPFYLGHVGELKIPGGRLGCKSHVSIT